MIEKVHKYSTGNEKVVEKLIMNDHINYIHMVFNQGEGLPEHYSNSNVYMNVIRGRLSLSLGEQAQQQYPKGSLIEIPYNIKMHVQNTDEEVLELIVVKAPGSQQYRE